MILSVSRHTQHLDVKLFDHLDTSIAIACRTTLNILQYNEKFHERVLSSTGIDGEYNCANLATLLPSLKPQMLERALARKSKYRVTQIFTSRSIQCPVDFIINESTINNQKYILVQGIDNPQSLEIQKMIESYDSVFKAQTQELNQAKEKSQQASEVKSQFLSRMSHELRTPMNAILGFAQLQAIQLNEESELKQNNEHILKAGFDLLELIEKMFDFVETEQHEEKLELSEVSLQHCLNDAVTHCLKQSQTDNITINSPSTNLIVKAHGEKLTNIFKELINNGIKFNNPGGYININVFKIDDSEVEISFSDGCGNINDDEIDKLFTPFFRSSYAQANEIPGIGIGLVLSQRVAEQMHGQLDCIKNRDRSGVTFYLHLPCVK